MDNSRNNKNMKKFDELPNQKGLENVTNSEINSNTRVETLYYAEKQLEELQESFDNNPSLLQNVELIEDFNAMKKLINKEKNLTEVETNSAIVTDDEEDFCNTDYKDFDESTPKDVDKLEKEIEDLRIINFKSPHGYRVRK